MPPLSSWVRRISSWMESSSKYREGLERMSPYATTFKAVLLFAPLLGSCKQTSSDPYQNIAEGTISYPFADQTRPLGKDADSERLVIRSVKGGAEDIDEVPHNAS